MAGGILVTVGYISNVTQTVDAMRGISFLYNVAESLLAIVAVIFIFFYDLDVKKHNQIIEDLKNRETIQ